MKKGLIVFIALIILMFGGLDFLSPLLMICLLINFLKKNSKVEKTTQTIVSSQNINSQTTSNINGVVLKCTKCGNDLEITNKFCTKCGEPFDGNNVKVEIDPNNNSQTTKKIVTPVNYDSIFRLNEKEMIEEFINRELIKAQIDKNTKLITSEALKKKKIFNVIFSLLLFIYIVIIFFHFPKSTYIIGFIILITFFKLTRGYDIIKYLKKELKSRPSEKISNIVMNVKTTSVVDDSKRILIIGTILAIILPICMFIKPVILYEKMDGGYGVRYYIFGITNFTTATIPETYKNEKVISLRGNTFSNMPFLKEIKLPDTITEIRGQAFKNNKSLVNIKLPNKLNYLGGGSFYNCTSLTSIEIPDTVTYLGGESFYNAKSLKSVKLSNNITEIRGSTFENCKTLESIIIPDKVTRIGGHAFYGNSSLSEVIFTENSSLTEIGSSAFRNCDNLYNITIPSGVSVNERAFKESPTTVKKFGEVDYGSLINSSDYTYSRYIYMDIGGKDEINIYRENGQLQSAYISLENVVQDGDSYKFTIKYSDANGEEIFTLSATEPYKIINGNIAVEIASSYVLNYSDRVSLNAYYN